MATDNPRSTRVTRVAITTGDADSRWRITRMTPVLFYKTAVVPPASPAAGFPGRSGRTSWGPKMKDERRKSDFDPYAPNEGRELDADMTNQMFWQSSGIGILSPLAVIRYEPQGDGPQTIRYGAFAWDQQLYLDAEAVDWPSYLQILVNGTGDVSFVFDTQVLGQPDEDGVQQLQPLVFTGGMVDVNPWAGGYRGFAEFSLLAPSTFRVKTYLNGPNNQPFTLAVW